ncbi:F0F1 ATP synthase subunit epsilon [Euhalothece natronophila Z-M001]|uniref:ATP synthase epsilon chain n=1 Tax=Euhalothece natronophila Z-M001 TaxID=522448 RepID=A0A5B8NS86_9CHRO|nr:ATP synthase F1 subunit epsilon [Euhalothece natronophila]QDZ41115.1 F0F1 ATP synthase subunit epsilon [Euhalothece natronophila Z-M001]
MSLNVRVITPDNTVWDATAEEIILPSTTGQLGILSGHAPLLSALDVGVMRLRPQKDWLSISLAGGFVEVEEDEVTILVNSAERGDNIDPEEAQKDYDQAKQRLEVAQSSDQRQEIIQATQALKKARSRLQAATGKAPA